MQAAQTEREALPMPPDVDLMTLYWMTAGVERRVSEISPYSFQDRVEAASSAGFRGVGLWHRDIEHCLQQLSLQEMKQILYDNGIRHIELAFVEDWFQDDERKRIADQRLRFLLEASAVLDARHIKVGDFNNTPCPMTQIIDAFAAICNEAANYGATIGFEFMKRAMIHSWADCLTMVESAGADNGGLIVDIAHVMHLGISLDEVTALPSRYLINAELSDGILSDGAQPFTPAIRRFCGEGEFDIRGFIQAVRATGYSGPWAIEVLSPEVVSMPLAALNRRAYETSIVQFAS
jgi:sugar phosphate isomerase/epimerase